MSYDILTSEYWEIYFVSLGFRRQTTYRSIAPQYEWSYILMLDHTSWWYERKA